MNASKARDEIYQSMDALSLGMDVRDNLFQLQKSVCGYITKINKVIEKGRDYNKQVEVQTRHKAA